MLIRLVQHSTVDRTEQDAAYTLYTKLLQLLQETAQ